MWENVGYTAATFRLRTKLGCPTTPSAIPKYVLRTPPRWGKRHRRANVESINKRCLTILETPLPSLWDEINTPKPHLRPQRKRFRSDAGSIQEEYDEVLEAQMQSLIADGAIGKAAKQLTSTGIHDVSSPFIWETLQQLHPQPDTLPQCPTCPSWGEPIVSDSSTRKKLLREAILSFPAGSACGPSGLRPRHLQDILQGDMTGIARILYSLDLFMEACESGNLPMTIASWICSATLIPLKKPSGNKVRPIAVGETIRRLVEKVLMALPETKATVNDLQPIQLGQGQPCAAEMVGRSLQQSLDGASLLPDWGILQIDRSNAFDTVDRNAVLAGVAQHCPHLLPWTSHSLGAPTRLFSPFGELLSSQGVQQGSPLGPLLFNVAIHRTICECPVDLDWNVWYMDDGTLMGPKAHLEAALQYFQLRFETLGLSINLSKCNLWGPAGSMPPSSSTSPFHHVTHIPWSPGSGIVLLGVPIHFPGDPTFLRQHFTHTLDNLKATCATLTSKIRDPTGAPPRLLLCMPLHLSPSLYGSFICP